MQPELAHAIGECLLQAAALLAQAGTLLAQATADQAHGAPALAPGAERPALPDCPGCRHYLDPVFAYAQSHAGAAHPEPTLGWVARDLGCSPRALYAYRRDHAALGAAHAIVRLSPKQLVGAP